MGEEPSTLKHATDVYVAITLNHVESSVLHGENSGRHLIPVVLVQQIEKIGKLNKAKRVCRRCAIENETAIPINNLCRRFRAGVRTRETGGSVFVEASTLTGGVPVSLA